MHQLPRERTVGLFTREELLVSIVQGLIIAAGTLLLYYFFMNNGTPLPQTRNIVFTTLLLSNILLTFVNRSFTETITRTIFYKNPLAPVILLISVLFLAALHFIQPVKALFHVESITGIQFMICLAVAITSVMWFELYKANLVKPEGKISVR